MVAKAPCLKDILREMAIRGQEILGRYQKCPGIEKTFEFSKIFHIFLWKKSFKKKKKISDPKSLKKPQKKLGNFLKIV